jgi:histidinol phosphatase-like enzyme
MDALNLVIIEAATQCGDAWSGCSDDAATAVSRLNHLGIPVALLTSFRLSSSPADVAGLNRYNAALHRDFADNGAQVDALLFCPHCVGETCACRLPSPRLLLAGCHRFCTHPARTAVIAASAQLAMASQRAAIKSLCLGALQDVSRDPSVVVGTLREGVEHLLGESSTSTWRGSP